MEISRIARVRVAAATTALLACWLALPRAVQDAATQVFKGGVDLVRVDVYPRRGSQLVEGLQASDFQIFEDGKPQTIATFEFIPAPSGDAADREDPRNDDEAARWIADPARRVFIVYIDLYHISHAAANATYAPLMAFLSHTIGPKDVVAVMTPEVAVSALTFAGTLNTLSAEIAREWTWGLADPPVMLRTPAEEEIAACASTRGYDQLIRRHRDIVLMTSLESLVTRLGAMREERTSVILLSQGWTNGAGRALPGGAAGRGFGGRFDRQFGAGSVPQDARPMPESPCGAVLGRIDGYDYFDHFKNLLRSAAANNISFYPVDVGGLGTSTSRGAIDTLQELAENTGGFATVDSNDLAGALARVTSSIGGYYLLGYYATNEKADGRYHAIDVRLKPSGLTVTARRGYFAPSPEAARTPADGPVPTPVPADIAQAIGRLSRLDDARMVTRGIVSDSSIDLVVEIARRAMESGEWRDGAAVRVAVTGASGQVRTATGRVESGASSTVIHVPRDAGDAGPWQASVTVSGVSSDLDDRLQIDAPAGPLLGAPRLSRASARPHAVLEPAAGAAFARGDRVRVEWPLVAPTDTQAIRVLDRRGQPLSLGAAMTDVVGAGRDVLAVDVNLAAVAEGDYVFEAVAQHGGKVERRLLPFRVGR